MSLVLLVARHELVLAMRSRWLQLFAALFALLALLVSGAGYVLSGGYGVQDFARTSASLIQLVLLLVPLTALSFGAMALTPDRGNAELLFAQPVSRARILCGKYLGLVGALIAAEAIGFGFAGLVLHNQTGRDGVGAFMIVVVTAFGLTCVFVSIAAALAHAGGGRRSRVLAVALIVWFVAVVLYDVAVLGAASFLRSGHASRLLITAALVNPVDAARTTALMGIEGTAAFGAASLALLRFTGGPVMAATLGIASVAVWVLAPMLVAIRRLRRADL